MFSLVALLLEGSEKLSGAKVTYGAMASIVLTALLALTWTSLGFDRDNDVIEQEIWRILTWVLVVLLFAVVILAFLTRPAIDEHEATSQLAKANTIGACAAVIALVMMGTRALERDFPNYLVLMVTLQLVVFLAGIIIRTLNTYKTGTTEAQPPITRPMYVHLAIITGAVLIAMATNLRAIESEMKGTPFRSEVELMDAIVEARRFPLHDSLISSDGTTKATARELFVVLEKANDPEYLATLPERLWPSRYKEPYYDGENEELSRLKESMAVSTRTLLGESMVYRNSDEELERYRFLRTSFVVIWTICMSFWIFRILGRFKLIGNLKGL